MSAENAAEGAPAARREFRKPGEAPKDRLSDYLDEAVVIQPQEFKMIETKMGDSLALMCQVLVLTPKFVNLGVVPIFWKGVQVQLEESAGEWVLGRLHQGTASNPKAFTLLEGRPEDEGLADAAVQKVEGQF